MMRMEVNFGGIWRGSGVLDRTSWTHPGSPNPPYGLEGCWTVHTYGLSMGSDWVVFFCLGNFRIDKVSFLNVGGRATESII
jgi:hypothetical protein